MRLPRSRVRAALVAVTLTALALPVLSFSQAQAAVGDVRQTVDLPAAAQCSSGIGTSVAVVPGPTVGFLDKPILLVVSCFDGGTNQGRNLYIVDPSTSPATLAKTITTSPTPQQGWGSLAVRGDKGDLLGCGNADDGTHAIYSINITPFDGTANDGTATFLFNAQPGESKCDGVTWDTSDNTVFQSPDVSDTIYHFSATGTVLGSFAAPSGCPNSGLAVGGASLFASCNGVLTINQLDKTNGTVFTSFPSGGTRTEDLECDPVSFAASNVDVMWSKDAFENRARAIEIPDGTCGFAGGPPVVPPQCADTDGNGNTDNDGDGLCDNWEATGIDANNDGTVDLQLYDVNQDGTIQATEDADPNHKDIYLEIDFMALHQPNANAINDVIAAFASAPVNNPDLTTGVRLHVQVDEQAVAHNNNLAFEPCTGPASGGMPDFDTVKNASFGTGAERAAGVNMTNAKRFASHYVLFAHKLNLPPPNDGSSGCSELPGNDLVVSLGGGTVVGGHNVGSRDQQAGTLMHELGHNLNLRHGGIDNINCKPNYLSVMSYSRQFNNQPIPGRPLDYSRGPALPTLNEASLNEIVGISGPVGNQTAFGPPPPVVVPSNGAIDWDQDLDGGTELAVSVDINNVLGSDDCPSSPGQMLQGYDDWTNLKYDFQNTIDFADGVHLSVLQNPEITMEEAAKLAPLEVTIDVTLATLKLSARGLIPVVILTAPTFDATTVIPATICFGSAEIPAQRDCTEAHGRGHIRDVDGDGDADLVLHYESQQTGIALGDTQACLAGRTTDNKTIVGCDIIRVIS